MVEELIALIQAVCAVGVAWGGVLCFCHQADSSAGLHMFDESGPVQSRQTEDVSNPSAALTRHRSTVSL